MHIVASVASLALVASFGLGNLDLAVHRMVAALVVDSYRVVPHLAGIVAAAAADLTLAELPLGAFLTVEHPLEAFPLDLVAPDSWEHAFVVAVVVVVAWVLVDILVVAVPSTLVAAVIDCLGRWL